MIRVCTPSRLHFGLFSLPSAHAAPWTNYEGQPTLPRRNFGGVGLMVQQPGIELAVQRTKEWESNGPRSLRFAQTYCKSVGITDAFQIRIDHCAPEHAGLGTGTQLGMAVARGIAKLTGQPFDAATLAGHVQRGLRSGLGVHGFQHGGLLIEGGKTEDSAVSPLLYRCDFSEDWHVLLITVRDLVGTHGRRELDAFAKLCAQPPDERGTEALCRLVLLSMLPALAENDLQTFGEAVYDFNRRSGALFKSAQGGIYADPRVEAIVKTVREFGVKGVGQSSWGPTIFAFVRADEAGPLGNWLMLKHGIEKEEMTVTVACNHGAVLSTDV